MTYQCKVRKGTVQLPPEANLPDGTIVRVEVLEGPSEGTDPVYSIGDLAVDTGLADLSVNLDHYLYGHPKVSADE